MAPLAVRSSRRRTQVQLLGGHSADHARLPAVDGRSARELGELVAGHLEQLSSPWHLRLEHLPAHDPVAQRLAELLPGSRWRVAPELASPYVLLLPGATVDDYLGRAARKSRRRTCRAFAAAGGRVSHTGDPDRVAALLPELARVRRARDHRLGRVSDLDSSDGLAFWTSVLIDHAHSGELEVATAYVGGRLVAYDVVLLDGPADRLWDGRVAPEAESLSVGRLLQDVALARAIDRGSAELDLLRGVTPAKLRLATDVRVCSVLEAWSNPHDRRRELTSRAVVGWARSTKEAHEPLNSLWRATKRRRVARLDAPGVDRAGDGSGATASPCDTEPARVVDLAPGGPAVVIGSLPPHGRDLDLAVRGRDVDATVAALGANGFRRQGHQYVRFGRGTAQVVELTVLEDWHLPDHEVEALLTHARPLPGRKRLVRPAPAHVLLLLAAQCARTGALGPARRARLEAALREDPEAWQTASRVAGDWHADRALAVLRRLVQGDPPTQLARLDALAQARRATGTSWARATVGAARRLLRPPRRGAVVALSGVDGAGKSSQARALAVALERLGEDPVVVWSRVRYDPLLAGLGGVAKSLLAPMGVTRSGTVSLRTPAGPSAEQNPDAGRDRARTVVDISWAHVSAAIDGYRHRRLCTAAVLRGRVVICDRYTLDTHVHLAERFSAHPGAVRGAARLNRLLSPRPLVAFWLDLPARTAWTRKPDDVDPTRLREHVDLYRLFHADHAAVRLDAQAGADDLAATIAHALWRARCPDRSPTTRPSATVGDGCDP